MPIEIADRPGYSATSGGFRKRPVPSRRRTIAGCRSDAEILTDFVRMLALETLLDDLHSTPAAENADTTRESGSVAGDHEPDGGEGQSWRRKSSSN